MQDDAEATETSIQWLVILQVVTLIAGAIWILVMQDLAPSGVYVAVGPVPSCPNGSAGKVAIAASYSV